MAKLPPKYKKLTLRFLHQVLSEILGFSNEIKADEVVVMDSKSIKLVGFNYDGRNEGSVHFWAGVGPQPSSKGHQVISYDVTYI